ncbi:hypothetical protein SRHO_G00081550 [Serrasalmus rhombeus]
MSTSIECFGQTNTFLKVCGIGRARIRVGLSLHARIRVCLSVGVPEYRAYLCLRQFRSRLPSEGFLSPWAHLFSHFACCELRDLVRQLQADNERLLREQATAQPPEAASNVSDPQQSE